MAASSPAPRSYLLLGPPDLLFDLQRDFAEVGWRMTVQRWQAVLTPAPEDAGAPEPGWPAEVTLAGVVEADHGAACQGYFQPG